MIPFQCPYCGKAHSAPDSLAGQQARCACGQVVQVPQMTAVSQATPTYSPLQNPSADSFTPPSVPSTPTMTPNKDVQALPPHGRLVSLGFFAIGALAMVMNHLMATWDNSVYLALLIIGPPAAFLGLGGMIEPKVAFAIGKYGTHLPWYYKAIAGLLAAVGVVVAILLAFYYLA